jgi:mono/diheme cytochrome c family protein
MSARRQSLAALPALPALLAFASLAGCGWDGNRMNNQPRCEAGDRRPWLPDQRCDQAAPAGTVAWRAPFAAVAAPAPTRATIARGADRFARICATCHGPLGDGNSVVAADMARRPPPSLHTPRITGYADPRLFEVITSGYGMMPSYAYQLTPSDRWAVIHYVRVLQRSQAVTLEALAPARREEAQRWLR